MICYGAQLTPATTTSQQWTNLATALNLNREREGEEREREGLSLQEEREEREQKEMVEVRHLQPWLWLVGGGRGCLQQYCSPPAVPAMASHQPSDSLSPFSSLSQTGEHQSCRHRNIALSFSSKIWLRDLYCGSQVSSHLESHCGSKQSYWLFFNFWRTSDCKVTGNVRSFQQVSKVFIISSESEKKPNPNVQPGWFSSLENDRECQARSWFASPSRLPTRPNIGCHCKNTIERQFKVWRYKLQVTMINPDLECGSLRPPDINV